MKKFLIAPSILSADFARLGEDTAKALEAGGDVVHFDVMDNHYVPNLTIGPLVCQSLHNYLQKAGIDKPIDVHLMVKPVDRLIPDFAAAGAASSAPTRYWYGNTRPGVESGSKLPHSKESRARLRLECDGLPCFSRAHRARGADRTAARLRL